MGRGMDRTHRRIVSTLLAGALATAAACRGDRAAAGEAPVDTAAHPLTVQVVEGVQADVAMADTLAFGRVTDGTATVANRGTTALTGARLQVFIQSPFTYEPVPGAAAAAVTQAAGGTELTWPVAPLAAGQAAVFPLRLRLPAATLADTAAALRIRATVLAGSGQVLGTAAEDTVRPRGPSAAACSGKDPHVARYGVGSVRLGMRAGELRDLCPGTRDTAWTAEGAKETGITFALAGHPLLAVLSADSVARIVVRDRGLATPAGAGVGSTVGDLRTRYGRACAGTGEGAVALWFPNAPGISFGLAGPPLAGWTGDAAVLPDTAAVVKMWVRRGTDDCPAPAAGITPQGGER